MISCAERGLSGAPWTFWGFRMHSRLTGASKTRLLACVFLTAAVLLLATTFGSGAAHADTSDTCSDNGPPSGQSFSFTCNFAINRFNLSLTNPAGVFDSLEFSAVPSIAGFSCSGDPADPSLQIFLCSNGTAPAGQPISGTVTLATFPNGGSVPAGTCAPYSVGANGPQNSNSSGTLNGQICSVGSTGGTGGSGTTGGGSGTHACVVPHVVGTTLSRAKGALKAAGCKLGKVRRVKASHRKRGRVLSQSPAAGKHLSAGARVKLAVGR
jgi:hypothetical protein